MSNRLDDHMTNNSQNIEMISDPHLDKDFHKRDEVSISKNFSILDSINHDAIDTSMETDETPIKSHFNDIHEILNRNNSQLRKHYVNDKKNWRIEPVFILFFILLMVITTMLLYYTNTYI